MTAKTRKEQIQQMLADDPTDSFLRYGLAMEYVGEGDDEAAVRCFEEIFAATPEYVPAYHQAAQVLIRLGRLAQARELLRKGIAGAGKQGDHHAAEEMQGLLLTL